MKLYAVVADKVGSSDEAMMLCRMYPGARIIEDAGAWFRVLAPVLRMVGESAIVEGDWGQVEEKIDLPVLHCR